MVNTLELFARVLAVRHAQVKKSRCGLWLDVASTAVDCAPPLPTRPTACSVLLQSRRCCAGILTPRHCPAPDLTQLARVRRVL